MYEQSNSVTSTNTKPMTKEEKMLKELRSTIITHINSYNSSVGVRYQLTYNDVVELIKYRIIPKK